MKDHFFHNETPHDGIQDGINYDCLNHAAENSPNTINTMRNYTENQNEIKRVAQQNVDAHCAATLRLFASQPQCSSQQSNTSFATEPTEITNENAKAFFRYDHTPIKFTGSCKGSNFEYATNAPYDIDNSHSDNPEDWVTPDAMTSRLKKLGINFWIVASRNHMLTKEKDGVADAARPRFHVYLPLSTLLDDSDRFVRLCKWCIKTFNADPKVSEKLFSVLRCFSKSL